MRVEIAEIENRAVYRVWHDGEQIVATSPVPEISAARFLLEHGADPDETLEFVRRGSDRVDIRAKIGALAKPRGRAGARNGADGAVTQGDTTEPVPLPSARAALPASEAA